VNPASVTAACPCGEVYELKPEYAGRLLECPVCGRHLRAGRGPATPRPASPDVDPAFHRDVFLLRERVLTITSKYEVSAEDGSPILYVERPTYPVRTFLAYVLGSISAVVVLGWVVRLTMREPAHALLAVPGYLAAIATFMVVSMSARPRRHVTVFRDDTRREVLLRVRQDQRIAVLVRTYTVLASDGAVLGRFAKPYAHNIVRKRWSVESPPGQLVALAVEDSVILSLLRRVLGPLFGVLRTNFVFQRLDGEILGEFNRKYTLFDRYVLDLTADAEGTLDRRLALALGIMLDTGERR
jgi:hypothetical protein